MPVPERTFQREANKIETAILGMDNAGQEMCTHAQVAGEQLLRVKEALPHGQWGKWLEANFSRTRRFAQMLIKFATEAREMECVTPKLLKEHWDAVLHPEPEPKPQKQMRSSASHLDTGDEDVIEADVIEMPEKDAVGTPIPEPLRRTFAEAAMFKQHANTLTTLKKAVHAAAEAHPDAWAMVTMQQFDEGIGNARRVLAQCYPHVVCPYCGGTHSKKCRGCRGSGFLDKVQYRNVPEELK